MNKLIEDDLTSIGKVIEFLGDEEELPEKILEISEQKIFTLKIKIPLKANILPTGEFKSFRVSPSDTVLEVMQAIAREFGVLLLPPEPQQPLDQLFCYGRNNQLIGPIDDLSQPIWRIIVRHRSRKFGLKLLLIIKVNSTWKIASKSSMSPREILDLFGMDYTQYTLYSEKGTDPLPLDSPLALERGECFAALKDGKYGDR